MPLGTDNVPSRACNGPAVPSAIASYRYKAPTGSAAMLVCIVPAQKRPWRSQRPSLKRMPGLACSTLARLPASRRPSAWGMRWKIPLSWAPSQWPRWLRAMQPSISSAVQWWVWPSGCQRCRRPTGMSTQYKAFSCGCQTGLSPVTLRASIISSAVMEAFCTLSGVSRQKVRQR
ncbi:hypothetical protein D3C78_1415200 [compost metagenome]